MPHLTFKTGIDWHYEIEGQGKPLLFLHGWGVDRRIWNQQIKHYKERFKVMSLDLPGHGESGWQKIHLEEMVQDIKLLLDSEGVQKLVVVGSSLGGLFALKLYELYPHTIEQMIFVGSMAKFAKDEEFPYGLDVQRIRQLSSQLDTAYPSIIDVFFRSLFTMHERESRRFKWLMKFRKFETPPLKPALSEYLDLLEKEDLRAVLKTVNVPITYLTGAEDYICPQEAITLLLKINPKANVHFFEKCGHFPFLTEPYLFNQILDEHLK